MLTIDELFEKLTTYLEDKKVLELGCGTGKFTTELAKSAKEVYFNLFKCRVFKKTR